MLVRIIAAIIFTSAGCAAGAAYSLRLREKCSISTVISDILRKTSVYIRYSALDVYEIVAKLKTDCPDNSFISRLPDSYIEGQNFHQLWQKALEVEELPEEERLLLSEFGSILGTSDIEGQLSAIASLSERAEQLRSERSENYIRKGRMYRSVGVLAGVMVGILVL